MITFALLLLAAQPAPVLASAAQDTTNSPEAQVLEVYDAVCVRSAGGPAGFQPVEWSSFPAALRLLNTYGHAGAFLRAEVDGRVIYAASTTGPGRDSIVSGERRCGVAIQGADFDRLSRTLARRLRGGRSTPLNVGPIRTIIFESPQGALSLNAAGDGWIILRAYDVTFR